MEGSSALRERIPASGGEFRLPICSITSPQLGNRAEAADPGAGTAYGGKGGQGDLVGGHLPALVSGQKLFNPIFAQQLGLL